MKSYVRKSVLGHESPASYPHYSHKFAFRGLTSMEQAVAAMGDYAAKNQFMHVGPGAHLIHYPVANNTMVNVAAFVHDEGDWPADGSMVAPASREEVQSMFRDWKPALRHLVSLLPEELDKWALFDTWDWPAPHYNKGKVCLVGDAAHASTPHHGAGACMGVEDVLCLVTLMRVVNHSVNTGGISRGKALTIAFETFNEIRRPRT